jgi:rubrerythrin
MFVNKCSHCGYHTPELQDTFCPVCSDMKVRPRVFVRLEQDVWV